MNQKPSDKKLKQGVKQFYKSQHLSEDQLEAMLHKTSTPKSTLPWQRVAIAAMLLIAVSLFFLFPTRNHYLDISSEIAYNHNSQMQMEVMTSSLSGIRTYLNRLDFSLTSSQHLPTSQWQVIGGRYCSIEGKLAAQIKVKHLETNEIYTLYQARLPDSLDSGVKRYTTDIDGVNVTLWEENGLLMGLAN
ncbi:hypothetical protein [Vibrio nigripulchritudo]|uniref:hypothetical protein n=1 Tax=Vibrio nigripulchritudo TaxID=28173 RepID=UPI0003B1D70A|nr:hypothetical protein [Vibrio nigripulchritudo]BCL73608.1 hypothetical protein VNTUMSATTG_55450 [Vibrio nigripulchritudo]BDU34976.1 hypothetical protein TUMSATVNIG1_55850 [Vibrio nigripulchritudo]CCN70064.1 conserved hypothetical protein [Vibrio nigripulchritudo SFn118]